MKDIESADSSVARLQRMMRVLTSVPTAVNGSCDDLKGRRGGGSLFSARFFVKLCKFIFIKICVTFTTFCDCKLMRTF